MSKRLVLRCEGNKLSTNEDRSKYGPVKANPLTNKPLDKGPVRLAATNVSGTEKYLSSDKK